MGDIDRRKILVLLGTAGIGGVGGASSSLAGAHSSVPHWGYEGDEGPDHWGDLSSSFRTCSTGHGGAPIDIRSADVTGQAGAVTLHSEPVRGVVVPNGNTLQVNVAPGCTATIDGTQYTLLQFHYHTPSEHTFGGQRWAAEWHYVYRSSQSNLAVIGLVVASGTANAAFAPVLAASPSKIDEQKSVGGLVDISAMIPADLRAIRYQGSLTTPPCTEGVRWTVLQAPIEMSSDQLHLLEGLHGPNARPVQPLNGRALEAGLLTR